MFLRTYYSAYNNFFFEILVMSPGYKIPTKVISLKFLKQIIKIGTIQKKLIIQLLNYPEISDLGFVKTEFLHDLRTVSSTHVKKKKKQYEI